MSRRALSPAARGVLLAVSAALRGRVATIDDQGDGTTHARVVEPDGTVLLDVRVRAVGRRDTRQPALPPAPGAPHETPAPVAVLPDARQPAPKPDDLYRVSIGQRVTIDDDEAVVIDVSSIAFTFRLQRKRYDPSDPDDVDCVEWHEVEEISPGVFRVLPVETETPAQQRAAKPSKARAAKARPARLTPEPEADALAEHGKVCLVGRDPDSGAWELFAADVRLSPESWTRAVGAYQRVRQYARGGKCTRDTTDEAAS